MTIRCVHLEPNKFGGFHVTLTVRGSSDFVQFNMSAEYRNHLGHIIERVLADRHHGRRS